MQHIELRPVGEYSIGPLHEEFEKLDRCVEALIGLLEESGETFWVKVLGRGVADIRQHKLAGATYLLGCFSGEGSLSDLKVAQDRALSDPLSHNNLNARLTHLRTEAFASASKIASRQLW